MSIDHSSIARKITATLFAAMSLGSAGFVATAAINSIAGAKLSGQPAWAGVPSSVYLIGGALTAFGWGYGMDRLGRRGGLTLGLILGVFGAGITAEALIVQSFWLFLAGMVLIGAANSAIQLGRFAAAEVYPPTQRGRAISNVVIGGAIGGIFGPLLVGPTGDWSKGFGLGELAGPYIASMVLSAIAALVIWLFLRPDPRDIGRQVAELYPEQTPSDVARSLSTIVRQPATMVAISAMVFGQLTMVMLMVITSLHMKDHNHTLGDISVVISSHTFGMFAFSIISGQLVDRFGRAPVIVVGAITLILACLTAPLSPDMLPISVALFLLGLGWNFCYVGGSTLLTDQLAPSERARISGFNDFLIGITSSVGSLLSGVIFALLGYATVGVVGAIVTLVPIALVIWWSLGRQADLQNAV